MNQVEAEESKLYGLHPCTLSYLENVCNPLSKSKVKNKKTHYHENNQDCFLGELFRYLLVNIIFIQALAN